jgi:hypothetical protein
MNCLKFAGQYCATLRNTTSQRERSWQASHQMPRLPVHAAHSTDQMISTKMQRALTTTADDNRIRRRPIPADAPAAQVSDCARQSGRILQAGDQTGRAEQRSTATLPSSTYLMRPPKTRDLHERPTSTSLPLVHIEEVTALPGLSGLAVLHVRGGARAAELVASDFHPFAAVRVQSGGSDLGQGHVQLRQL